MASSSNSPSSDSPNRISDSESEFYEATDEEFTEWKVVTDLVAAAGGDEDWSDEELGSGDGDERQMCVGGRNEVMNWGFLEEQGRRLHMEDRVVIIPAIMSMNCKGFGGCLAPSSEFASEESPIHYFAVFDGHGGSQVSDYCANSLHRKLTEAWASEACTDEWNQRWESALTRAYNNVDKACIHFSSGSTALVVVVSPCQIIAANCGDSRAILCRESYTIPLTTDHKPSREDEEERIVMSGGYVVRDPYGVLRVDGVLAMTRAIGDRSMKPYVSAVPELTFTTRTDEDECLIIASDGLWDVMSTKMVGTMATRLLRRARESARVNESTTATKFVARYLFKEACARSSTDNFSVIVVDLKMHH